MAKINYDILVQYQSNSFVVDTPEANDYLFNIRIKILGIPDSFSAEELVLGEGLATKVRIVQAINDKKRLFPIFACAADLLEAGRALFDSSFKNYQPAVEKQFPYHYFGEDLFIIRQLTIENPYPKRKIGLVVLHRILMDHSGEWGLTLLKPDLSGPLNPDRDQSSHYGEPLGFQRIVGSKYWAFDNYLRVPSIIELACPTSFCLEDQEPEA